MALPIAQCAYAAFSWVQWCATIVQKHSRLLNDGVQLLHPTTMRANVCTISNWQTSQTSQESGCIHCY